MKKAKTSQEAQFPFLVSWRLLGPHTGEKKARKKKKRRTKMCQMSRVMCQVSGVTCHVTPNHMVSKNLAFAIVPIFQEVITT